MIDLKYSLKDQKLFEIDVKPMVVQTNEIIPFNKMHWKFFELPKFQASDNYKKVDKGSPLKDQWLEFLIDCSTQKEEPDRNEKIIKGYEIMKVATWDSDTQALYWKQKATAQDILEAHEEARKEAEALKQENQGLKLKVEEEVRKVEEAVRKVEEAVRKGEQDKLKGEIKGEIKEVKSLVKYKVPIESFTKDLKFLTNEKVKDKLEENLTYIQEHTNDPDSDICDELDLIGQLLD